MTISYYLLLAKINITVLTLQICAKSVQITAAVQLGLGLKFGQKGDIMII